MKGRDTLSLSTFSISSLLPRLLACCAMKCALAQDCWNVDQSENGFKEKDEPQQLRHKQTTSPKRRPQRASKPRPSPPPSHAKQQMHPSTHSFKRKREWRRNKWEQIAVRDEVNTTMLCASPYVKRERRGGLVRNTFPVLNNVVWFVLSFQFSRPGQEGMDGGVMLLLLLECYVSIFMLSLSLILFYFFLPRSRHPFPVGLTQ